MNRRFLSTSRPFWLLETICLISEPRKTVIFDRAFLWWSPTQRSVLIWQREYEVAFDPAQKKPPCGACRCGCSFVFPRSGLMLHLGANLTGTNGSVLILSPNAPSGPLNSFWAQPVAGVEYAFAKGWTGKAYWGYPGYHEDETPQSPQDICVPLNFHTHLVNLSPRYAF